MESRTRTDQPNPISSISEMICHSTFGNRQGRTPLIPQDVQAYAAVRVDIWVIDASREIDFWWLEWIIGGKVDR